jgi:hypothetical protein
VNKSRINHTEFIHFIAIRNLETTEFLPNQARINNKNKKTFRKIKVFDLDYRLQFNAICSSGVMSGRFFKFYFKGCHIRLGALFFVSQVLLYNHCFFLFSD